MQTMAALATATAMIRLLLVLVRHAPRACSIIKGTGNRIKRADTRAAKLRAALIGLEDAANEVRRLLHDVEPPR